jgi:tripartite-type tricarboxylate transporter receptor subunit TctC
MKFGLWCQLAALTMGMVATANAAGDGPEWRPTRPVRLLLPNAPGGASDAVARSLTPKLHAALGQPWVLDNRGGGGVLAGEIVARAHPDGQTVFLALSNLLTVAPHLYTLPFDPAKELKPVAMATLGQYMLVLHPGVKADNVPVGSPERIMAAMERKTAKALAMPDVRDQIARQGLEVAYKPRGEFADLIRKETATWARVIADAGIKPE